MVHPIDVEEAGRNKAVILLVYHHLLNIEGIAIEKEIILNAPVRKKAGNDNNYGSKIH